jgi:hypothetical protein
LSTLSASFPLLNHNLYENGRQHYIRNVTFCIPYQMLKSANQEGLKECGNKCLMGKKTLPKLWLELHVKGALGE